MKRKIYSKLLEWKATWDGSAAVMVDGARRVGKSWIVREFAQNEYKSHIIIDFNNVKSEIVGLFEEYLSDLDEFFMRLSLYTGVKLYNRKTVIVFDEVQLYPKARAAIKYLVADGRYDYIETGSLVSINHNVKDIVIPSEEIRIDMYPMDLEEFMWATENSDLYDYCKGCCEKMKPVGSGLHRKMQEILRSYILVGGMPQAVDEYAKSKNFLKVDAIKRGILALYRNDISKYAGVHAPKVSRIFDSIPGMLEKHEKRFKPGAIQKGSKTRDYQQAMFWLDESRVVNFCYGVTEPNVALAMNVDDAKMKMYLADTGLLISMAFNDNDMIAGGVYEKILRGKLEFNKGMIVENLVAQMLRAAGHPLYFYSCNSRNDTDSRMEIDFLVRKSGITARHNVNAIEVKSGTKYSLKSLEKFMTKFEQYTYKGIVFHPGDLCVDPDGRIVRMPLYMASMIN